MTRDQILDEINKMAKSNTETTRACYEGFISEIQGDLEQFLDEQEERQRAPFS